MGKRKEVVASAVDDSYMRRELISKIHCLASHVSLIHWSELVNRNNVYPV